jgi:glycosyltransferase involved in cell wall biosynthesis
VSAKISICIPVKNGGAFLPLAVESVLQQSFDDAELIIVDNCSTDGTTKWLEEKAAATPRIHVHKNPRDIGMTANFNACLRHAKGEYVKFLCADDLLLPGCLQRMSLALDSDARTTLAVGGRELVDESGEKIAMQRYARRNITLPGGQVINRCIFGANYIGEPSAVMFRRQAAQRGFDESLSQLMDLEMWFHLLEQGSMANVADEVCAVRQHTGQMTLESIKTGALIDENIALFEQYGGKPYLKKSALNVASRKIRMGYRVWICRDNLTPDRKDQILTKSSSRLLYFLMIPAMAGLLSVWRKMAATARAVGSRG